MSQSIGEVGNYAKDVQIFYCVKGVQNNYTPIITNI